VATSSFAALLRHHRLAVGLTQEELADRAGLSGRGISDLERGLKQAPRLRTVWLLVRGLSLADAEAAALLRAAQSGHDTVPTSLPSHERHNLPLPLSRLVGRELEREAVLSRLKQDRLVTLTGVGGIGKTRLALESARAVLDDYADGVWVVELGSLTDPDLVAVSVATVVGVRETAGQSLTATLTRVLRTLRMLLVLDNCEHLLDTCAHLVDTLVRSCPDLRILATSREPLGIAGEVAWRVPSLVTPDPGHLPPLVELERTAAVQLFIERARAVEPHFALSERNAPAVAETCKRLDGIPLALELAAARVRALTVEQLVARLDQRFRLLTGGSRSAMRRQQTLQATLDWSYELLDHRERALFRRLAVFAGGWTLEAAEAVVEGEPIALGDVLDLLTNLIDKSLVLTDVRGAEERYGFLETVRQYAEDQLLRAGEAAAMRDRHRDWCLTLRKLEFAGRDSEALRPRLAAELDNLRAALSWCATHDAASGLTLICRFSYVWGALGGGHSEARRWLETLLARAPEPTPSRAEALLLLGHHMRWLHEFAQSGHVSNEALSIYVALGDDRGMAAAAAMLGLVAACNGEYEQAYRHLDEAVASARRRGDIEAVSQFLRDLGVSCIAGADFVRARTALTESANLAPRGSFADVLARLRLGMLDRLEGKHDRARERLLGIGHGLEEAGVWANFMRLENANQARAAGRFDEARASIIDVLRGGHRGADLTSANDVLAMLGICEIAAGAYARGVNLLGAASNVEGPIGTVHMPDVRLEAPIHLERAHAALGEIAFASAWAEGKAMTLEQALACALGTLPNRQASRSGGARAKKAVGE
jgi:predicted ATPase/DNA-binding XRE family transcriptional regulator